jgi:hypothetical protein
MPIGSHHPMNLRWFDIFQASHPLQLFDLVRALPRKIKILTIELSVGYDLAVNRPVQS